MGSEIKPRMVDGEALCSASMCPMYVTEGTAAGTCKHPHGPSWHVKSEGGGFGCAPYYRAALAESRAEVERLRGIIQSYESINDGCFNDDLIAAESRAAAAEAVIGEALTEIDEGGDYGRSKSESLYLVRAILEKAKP